MGMTGQDAHMSDSDMRGEGRTGGSLESSVILEHMIASVGVSPSPAPTVC